MKVLILIGGLVVVALIAIGIYFLITRLTLSTNAPRRSIKGTKK